MHDFTKILPFDRGIQFPKLVGKTVGELDDDQALQAHEDWIRQQFGHMGEYYQPHFSALLHIIDEQRYELGENEHLFELHWVSSRRAIKKWQAARPGNDLVWPDRTDLLVWLIEELEARDLSWWQRLLRAFAQL